MKCKCGTPMYISEWDGWKWYCPFCEKFDRRATDREIEEYEADINADGMEERKME